MATDERYVTVKEESPGSEPVLDNQSKADIVVSDQPDYSYGFSEEQLESQAIRGSSSSSGGSWTSGVVKIESSFGNADYQITGLGFKPRVVQCFASFSSSSDGGWSNGTAIDGDSGNCIYSYGNLSGGVWYGPTVSYNSYSLAEANTTNGVVKQRLTLKTMDADGFTVTVSNNTGNVAYIFTAFA